jgi:hypothetical protein
VGERHTPKKKNRSVRLKKVGVMGEVEMKNKRAGLEVLEGFCKLA